MESRSQGKKAEMQCYLHHKWLFFSFCFINFSLEWNSQVVEIEEFSFLVTSIGKLEHNEDRALGFLMEAPLRCQFQACL